MQNKKEKLILKALIVFFGILAFGVGIYLVVTMFANNNNYFTKHFGLPLVLASVAVVAFLLPIATKQKFSGDDSKDKLVMVVAVLLLLLAILSLALSYSNISFF